LLADDVTHHIIGRRGRTPLMRFFPLQHTLATRRVDPEADASRPRLSRFGVFAIGPRASSSQC